MTSDVSMSKLADIQKLQKIFSSIDIETMYAMSQSEKLQKALSSDDFFTTMASTLLFSRDHLSNEKSQLQEQYQEKQDHYQVQHERQMQQDLEKLHRKRQAQKLKKEQQIHQQLQQQQQQHQQGMTPDLMSSTQFDEATFLNTLSNEEKLSIQQKLSTYDNTLKATLDAIRSSGNFNSNKMLQPVFQDLPSDTEMQKFFEHIDPKKKLPKLKVDGEFSVSLETDSCASSNKNADEYIEKMIKVINQNKKFDNFLDAVSKIENISDEKSPTNVKLETEQPMESHDKEDITSPESVELNDEPANKELYNNVPQQIHKALESFKLDSEVEQEIASEIAKSIENNRHLFTNEEFKKSTLGNQQKITLENFDTNAVLDADNEDQFNADFAESMRLNEKARELFDPHVELQKWHEEFRKYRNSGGNNQNNISNSGEAHSHPKSSQVHQNSHYQTMSKLRNISTDPTPEEKLQLQRESLDRLRAIELQLHDDDSKKITGGKKKKSKKKNKKNKKSPHDGVNVSAVNHVGHNDPNNSLWLCELCEYKIVYGEYPIFLTEWLQRKAHHHQKMETYQRYLLEQRNERKRQHHHQQMMQHQKHSNQLHNSQDHDHYYEHNKDHIHYHQRDHEGDSEVDEDENTCDCENEQSHS